MGRLCHVHEAEGGGQGLGGLSRAARGAACGGAPWGSASDCPGASAKEGGGHCYIFFLILIVF